MKNVLPSTFCNISSKRNFKYFLFLREVGHKQWAHSNQNTRDRPVSASCSIFDLQNNCYILADIYIVNVTDQILYQSWRRPQNTATIRGNLQ
jgi:hypothetical protein